MIGAAIRVAQIATGEAEETTVNEARQRGGLAGGAARAKKLDSDQRVAIAKRAAEARWKPKA
ncbi:MAG: hypothetical protein Q7J13_02790 [Brevundimonas sp.]|uniref:hypothetical protein n=1 Tax=Brevundimonas sp. TaxID=1871086 RepID=UPI00271C3ADC|nr:hypothetical protein [Brevundimonas sp.]MDO9586837.1 hypothetical protein [Brevundimonas sp.]